jgi:hypothetical protein
MENISLYYMHLWVINVVAGRVLEVAFTLIIIATPNKINSRGLEIDYTGQGFLQKNLPAPRRSA